MAPAPSTLNDHIKLVSAQIGREATKLTIKVATCLKSSAKPAIKAQAWTDSSAG